MRSRSAVTTAHVSVIALALAQCLAAPPAAAQTRPRDPRKGAAQAQPMSLAQSLTGAARSDYEGGKLLFVNKDYANALIKFEHAHELSRDPRLLWNVAVCYKELRRYTRMLATLQRLLNEGGPLLTDQDREDAANAAAAVRSFVSPLKLTLNEPGATVQIDGETVGTAPFKEPPLVDVGSHEIRATKPGFKDAVKSVVVTGVDDVALVLTLTQDRHRGRLVVTAGADDLLRLDGKAIGRERWEGAVASGGHTLRVTAPGMQPYQTEVLVKDDEVRRIEVSLTPLAGTEVSRWLWIAGGSVLFAGAVVGGVVLFQPGLTEVDGTMNPPGTVRLTFGR